MNNVFIPTEGKPIPRNEDDQRCMTCHYHGNIRGRVACLYLQKTGNRRGSPPGLGCRRYIKGSLAYGGLTTSKCDMYRLDRDAWAELMSGIERKKLAHEIGVSEETLRVTGNRGTISLALAELINAKYHIKLIKTE